MAKYSEGIWTELHNLIPSEKDLIARFKVAPFGPTFMGAADILRKRGYLDECIIILDEGLRKCPHFHSARAALGRDYYLKGLMTEALAELEIVTKRTPDNLMAQRFHLRLAILFEDRDAAQKKLDILKKMGKDDEIVNTIRENLQLGSLDGARRVIIAELANLGIPGNWETDIAHKDTDLPARLK